MNVFFSSNVHWYARSNQIPYNREDWKCTKLNVPKILSCSYIWLQNFHSKAETLSQQCAIEFHLLEQLCMRVYGDTKALRSSNSITLV